MRYEPFWPLSSSISMTFLSSVDHKRKFNIQVQILCNSSLLAWRRRRRKAQEETSWWTVLWDWTSCIWIVFDINFGEVFVGLQSPCTASAEEIGDQPTATKNKQTQWWALAIKEERRRFVCVCVCQWRVKRGRALAWAEQATICRWRGKSEWLPTASCFPCSCSWSLLLEQTLFEQKGWGAYQIKIKDKRTKVRHKWMKRERERERDYGYYVINKGVLYLNELLEVLSKLLFTVNVLGDCFDLDQSLTNILMVSHFNNVITKES